MGKGSKPRPMSITKNEFNKRFDSIDWSIRKDIDERECIFCRKKFPFSEILRHEDRCFADSEMNKNK